MNCPRCQGLLVIGDLYDPNSTPQHVETYRCVCCGFYQMPQRVTIQTAAQILYGYIPRKEK